MAHKDICSSLPHYHVALKKKDRGGGSEHNGDEEMANERCITDEGLGVEEIR